MARRGESDNPENRPRKTRRGYKGVDLEAPVNWHSHHSQEAGRMTADLLSRGVPFVLFPMRDDAGNFVSGGFGASVLVGQQVSPRFIAGLRGECVRLEEWTPSTTAQSDIPPCLACYVEPLIENCPDNVVRHCTAAAVPDGFARTPAQLAKALSERMTADRMRGEAIDDAERLARRASSEAEPIP